MPVGTQDLITRCPSCRTAFRAHAEQVAARGGMVRCGRCGRIFDALAEAVGGPPEPQPALAPPDEPSQTAEPSWSSEPSWAAGPSLDRVESPAPDGSEHSHTRQDFAATAPDDPYDLIVPPREESPAAVPHLPESAVPTPEVFERGSQVFEHGSQVFEAGSQAIEPAPQALEPGPQVFEAGPQALGPEPELRQPEPQAPQPEPETPQTQDPLQPVPEALLAGPEALPLEQQAPPPVDAAAPSEQPELPAPQDEAASAAAAEPAPNPAPDALAGSAEPPIDLDFGRPRRGPARLPRWFSVPAALLLLLLLLAQIAYFARGELVVLYPAARPAAERLCARLRCDLPVPQHAELLSIEVSGLQAETGNPDVMVLSASLRNRAPFAQARPALELTLTDGQDQPVARRVLGAADYSAAGTPADPLPAGAELPVKMYFQLNGVKATGYRLYLFYP